MRQQTLAFKKRLLDTAAAIPGVTAAAIAGDIPLSGSGSGWFVYKWDTKQFVPSHRAFVTPVYPISPGYLQLAGTRLQSGPRLHVERQAGGARRRHRE
jgi:hypothetical protein